MHEFWERDNEVVFLCVELFIVDLFDGIFQLGINSFFFEETKTRHLLDWQEPAKRHELVRVEYNKLLDLER
jgi:hypothetical protein